MIMIIIGLHIAAKRKCHSVQQQHRHKKHNLETSASLKQTYHRPCVVSCVSCHFSQIN